jgi:hypothetical protein
VGGLNTDSTTRSVDQSPNAAHPLERLSFVNLCLTIDELFASYLTRRHLRRKCVKAALMHSVETVIYRLRNGECVFGLDCSIDSRCSRNHSSMMTMSTSSGKC